MLVSPANLRIGFFDGDYSLPGPLACGDDPAPDLPPPLFSEIESRV
jgi:hypothetical protein